MIKTIELNDRQINLLINVLREVKEDLDKNNSKVLERNKHKSNYLNALNENELNLIAVKNLLSKLE